MALVIKDRVKELTTTAGTGAVTLLGSPTGYQTFTSAVGNGNTTYYAIVDNTSGDWEVGLGTYTSATTSLSRDTVLSSSNAGSLVTFSSSSKDVFVTYPASKGIYTDSAGNTIALGTPASATLTNATGLPISTGVSGLGTGIATFLATPSSANLASAVTDETGSGSLVFATSPTLVTPVLGTPSSGTLTSCTGYTYANLSGTVPTWNQNTTGTAAGLSSTLVVGSGGTGTSTSFTTGSVVFAGASGTYTQDNANFFWDDTNNYLGIGTATPSTPLNVVANTSVDAVRITQTGAGNALVVEDSANPDSTPFVIDAAGQVIQGNATNVAVANPISGLALSPSFEIVGNSALTTPTFIRQETSVSPQCMIFAKSRGSVSSPTVVASADVIGRLSFQGYDGANFIRAAAIDVAVDGTPGTTDMPGRLIFSTTADGASSPTEAMRITSAGNVGIGTTSPAYPLTVGNSTAPTNITTLNALFSTDTTGGSNISIRKSCNAINGPNVSLLKSRGTAASPTAVNSGDFIGAINFNAYGGTNYTALSAINAIVDTYTSDTNISSYLTFSTSPSGSATATERMRIHSSGGVSIGNTTDPGATNLSVTGTGKFGTTVGVGAATPSASGSGITFPATQSASTDANTLDDYEEGTWTPADASGASLSFTSITAKYTKVGNLVTVYTVLTFPTTASTAQAQISGLPFTPGVFALCLMLTPANSSGPGQAIGIASTTLSLYSQNGLSKTNANMSGLTVYISGTYAV